MPDEPTSSESPGPSSPRRPGLTAGSVQAGVQEVVQFAHAVGEHLDDAAWQVLHAQMNDARAAAVLTSMAKIFRRLADSDWVLSEGFGTHARQVDERLTRLEKKVDRILEQQERLVSLLGQALSDD